eukprot:m.123943 g.123943  ORF g.123943 m.123943 type:complete len:867 (-) comp15581_c2_seq1:1382-3982(-)
MSIERLTYRAETWTPDAHVLARDETLTVIAACSTYFVVGTTLGNLLVFDTNGEFLIALDVKQHVSRQVTTFGAINHVVCSDTGSIAFAIATGLVWCWNWKRDQLECWSAREDKVVGLAITPRFDLNAGTLFVSRKPSTIFRLHASPSRKPTREDVITVAWQQTDTVAPPLRNLCLEQNMLLFSMHHQVFSCNPVSGKLLASFRQHTGETTSTTQEAKTSSSSANATTHNSTPVEETVQQQSRRLDSVEAVRSIICVGEYVMVHYASIVYMFARATLSSAPFTIVRVITTPFRDSFLASTGPHLFFFNQKQYAEQDGCVVTSLDGKQRQCLAVHHGSLGAVLAVCTYFVVQRPDVEGFSRFGNTHVIALLQRSAIIIRVAKNAEQVLSLCSRYHFALAQHICQQRIPQPGVLVQISNEYACRLWHKGLFEEAMRVWGEQVLPVSSASFWNVFAARLDECNSLHLLVKWLPFNDRSKLRPEVYLKLLTQPLLGEQYALLLSRVARWPVLYPAQALKRELLHHVQSTLGFPAISFADALALFDGDQTEVVSSCVPQGVDPKSIFFLLTTIFKLSEFASQRSDVWQLLFWLKFLERHHPDSLTEIDAEVETVHLDDEDCRMALRRCLQAVRSADLWLMLKDSGIFATPGSSSTTTGTVLPTSPSHVRRSMSTETLETTQDHTDNNATAPTERQAPPSRDSLAALLEVNEEDHLLIQQQLDALALLARPPLPTMASTPRKSPQLASHAPKGSQHQAGQHAAKEPASEEGVGLAPHSRLRVGRSESTMTIFEGDIVLASSPTKFSSTAQSEYASPNATTTSTPFRTPELSRVPSPILAGHDLLPLTDRLLMEERQDLLMAIKKLRKKEALSC